MELFSKIIKVILIIALAIGIIGLTAICIFSSTILNESYILKELQSSNYYSNIYKEVQENFENYIGPSGLDENIFTDICTVQDVQRDTELILGNIYEGTEKQIDVNTLKDKIIIKMNEAIKDKNNTENIQQFAQTLCDEYKNSISHTDYEKQIYDLYIKTRKIVNYMKTAICVCITVSFIAIILLNLKKIQKILCSMGMAAMSAGAFWVISKFIIEGNVRVQNIKILNNPVSTLIQNIIKDILTQFLHTGLIFIAGGVILIIIGNLLQVKNTKE